MRLLFLACLGACVLGSDVNTHLKAAQEKLRAYAEKVGDPFDPGMAALLERIVELDPDDAGALGDLVLQRVHRQELPEALKLLKVIEKHENATGMMRATAVEFASVLDATHRRDAEAIAKLRSFAAELFLFYTYNELKENPNFLHGVQGECMQLASKLDADVGGPRPYLTSYLPGLLARPFWEARRFELGAALEDAAETISKELALLRSSQKLWKPVGRHTGKKDEAIVAQGKWVDALLFRKGSFNTKTCKIMEETCALLKQFPEVTTAPMGMALVSELLPGTTVSEHVGMSNSMLTFHLGLQLPPAGEAGIRVDGQDSSWAANEVTAFDDAFPHSVWHHGPNNSAPRTVLLVRAWHPEVSPAERQVALITAMQMNSKDAWEDEDAEAALEVLKGSEAKSRWEAQLHQAVPAARWSSRQPSVEL